MPTDHVSVTVDIDLLQMIEHEKEQWQGWSIYKLPASVTYRHRNAYKPQVVSFGPYHYNDYDLVPMKTHKARALKHFLKRSGVTREECLQSLSGIVGNLMGAYDSLGYEFLDYPDAFLELMILDGCFMLEIFRAWRENILDYAENDPIFSEHGKLYVMPHLRRDMLMLENQIPMKVLHKLYQLQQEKEDKANKLAVQENEANKLIFQFFFPSKSQTTPPSNSLHILDMYRTTILGPYPVKTKKKFIPEGDDIIRSAVELHEAGIKIQRSKTKSLRDITFENGELRLPMIVVDDVTKPLFLNLIAFERVHVGAGNDVTSYIYFMDNMIEDATDIRLLHSKDIIQNGIGNDEAAAKLFNSLSKDVALDKNSPHGEIYKRVNAYCEQRIPNYRLTIYHTYHSYLTRPVPIIFAAVLLYVLNIIQTAYTVMDHHTGKG